MAPPITKGIYVITKSDGSKYVGQSGNIVRRLREHLASGRFTKDEIEKAIRIQVKGGKTKREIAEQRKINELREKGVVLINKVNPLGPKRWDLLRT